MVIQGLQKLTLLDYPGKVACTIFTAGCNFRCPFCHNASLVITQDDSAEISEEEFQAIRPLKSDPEKYDFDRWVDSAFSIEFDFNSSIVGNLRLKAKYIITKKYMPE